MSNQISISPLPHQKEGILRLEKCGGRTLLADEMGLGKTIQVLGALHRNHHWLPGVIVCPSSVKWQWEHEALKFKFRASVCEGRKPPTTGGFDNKSPLYIINYDILNPAWVEWLIEAGVVTLIVDECQYLSSLVSKRKEAVTVLSRSMQQIMGLSGTPLQSKTIELFPMLNIIWPKDFPSLLPFAHAYCDAKMVNGHVDYNGSSNVEMLNKRLIDLGMIRRKKEQVINLPQKNYRMVGMPIKDVQQYRHAEGDFLGWLRTQDASKVAKARKVEDLAKVGYLLRLCADLKLDAVIDHINQFFRDNPGKKLVVMAVHKKIIKEILARVHQKSIVIDGSVTGMLRHEAVLQFQKDPHTLLAVCNIKAAGVGINLTAAATLMFVELWWNPASLLQAADRIHRIGQLWPVDIQYLISMGTIEKKLCRILQARQIIANRTIDGTDRIDFSVYDELVASILQDTRGGGFFNAS